MKFRSFITAGTALVPALGEEKLHVAFMQSARITDYRVAHPERFSIEPLVVKKRVIKAGDTLTLHVKNLKRRKYRCNVAFTFVSFVADV